MGSIAGGGARSPEPARGSLRWSLASLLAFLTLTFENLADPLIWHDEGGTLMFAKRVLAVPPDVIVVRPGEISAAHSHTSRAVLAATPASSRSTPR